MANNGKGLIEFPPVQIKGSPTVYGFCAQVVITCSCTPAPMMIPFVVRAKIVVTCPKCKTSYRIKEFSWNINMDAPQVMIQSSQPDIVIANAGDVPKV